MRLAAGSRLGPYEVVSPVGAGGMGEVYKARDTRLDRTVAIKVLPEQLSNDAERRARFEREARAVSSLNHPHICTLHDVGRENGVDYLVMEYLEGESLAQRLEKGPLPLEQVLRYGIEIAEALAAAHKRGVIHRDLKPGNVVLAKSGAKLLDFGLAKTHATQPASALSELATGTRPLTETGTLMGTFQYMAPEQLEGKEADARTDLWAFGCVVYEMATGKRAFTGKSQASLIAAILEHEPVPLSSAQPTSPPALDRLVRKCLAKDPDERWDSAHDVADELKWIAGGGSSAGFDPPSIAPARSRRETLAWAIAAMATVAAIALAIALKSPGTASQPPVVHLVAGIEPAEQLGLSEFGTVRPSRTAVALSPDGRLLVFSATRGGVTQLYVRPLDRVEATPLPGSEGGHSPVFSPDGKWVAFWAENKLKKLALGGAPAVVICEAAMSGGLAGASWRNGTIAFSLGSRILRVRDSGGDVETVTTVDPAKEAGHLLPQLLPDGKALLFTRTTSIENWEKAGVVVQRLDNGERRTLIPGASDARYVETGHLLYMKAGTLMADAFDATRLKLAGTPSAMLEGVMHAANMPNSRHEVGAGQYSVSSNGTLAFVSGGVHPDPAHVVVWVDRRGLETALNAPPANYWSPRISPDGRRLAYHVQRPKSRESDIWIHDLARGTPTRLTFEHQNTYPVWSPDGTSLVFSHASSGRVNLHLTKADGTGTPERLATSEQTQWANAWSHRNNTVAFVQSDEIWVLPMEGERRPSSFLKSPAGFGFPDFSPDGRWLAYVSSESGRNEVYVRPYPGPGAKQRISTEGGLHPAWAPSGSELFYRSGSKMMVVAADRRNGLEIGQPQVLWERSYRSHTPIRAYDVSPDGQRFIMIKTVSEAEKPFTQVHVILNWTEELKRRAPAN